MMQIIDPKRFDAFKQLLAEPDPADLPRRAHVWRYDGEPNRRATRLPRILQGWLQQRHLTLDGEEPMASPRRAYPALRMVRRTGTYDQ